MRLNEQYIVPFLDRGRYARLLSRAGECRDMLAGGGGPGSEYTGWLSLADGYDPAELERIERTAAKSGPKRICLSWSGSAARLWARSPRLNFYRRPPVCPEVLFAGNSLSPDALARVLDACADREVCVNVISKSGTTTEPGSRFCRAGTVYGGKIWGGCGGSDLCDYGQMPRDAFESCAGKGL